MNNETGKVEMVVLSKDVFGMDEDSISDDDIDVLNVVSVPVYVA